MLTLEYYEDRLSEATQAGRTLGCMFCDVEPDLVLAETENLYLIRDKYPIVKNHLMVISKGHYGCMGELPVRYFSEIEELRTKVEELYQTSPYIVYEHGRAGHCVKLQGSQITCHHFHLHFVPVPVDIHPILQKEFVAKKAPGLLDVRILFQKSGEYLYFEDSSRIGSYYAATHHVAPHLLRTLVCDSIGLSNRSDWEQL